MNEREFEVGGDYRNTGQPKNRTDQFMRWINIPGSGMGNSAGIRPLNFVTKPAPTSLHAAIVLVTRGVPGPSHNPWDDSIDTATGRITYWGDAKAHPDKRLDDFRGNKALRAVHDAILEGRYSELPPILHFSNDTSGYVRFNGLCVVEGLDLASMEDQGVPVRNYRCRLSILDAERVSAKWLSARRSRHALEQSDTLAPSAWREYTKRKAGRFEGLDQKGSLKK